MQTDQTDQAPAPLTPRALALVGLAALLVLPGCVSAAVAGAAAAGGYAAHRQGYRLRNPLHRVSTEQQAQQAQQQRPPTVAPGGYGQPSGGYYDPNAPALDPNAPAIDPYAVPPSDVYIPDAPVGY